MLVRDSSFARATSLFLGPVVEEKMSGDSGTNKNVRIRLDEYLFSRAYPFTKRMYIEGKEILSRKQCCFTIFDGQGKNIVDRENEMNKNVRIQYLFNCAYSNCLRNVWNVCISKGKKYRYRV